MPLSVGSCYTPGALTGQTGAYFALFSEIGILLLVTTLCGALAGHWLDLQIRSTPIFLISSWNPKEPPTTPIEPRIEDGSQKISSPAQAIM